MIQRLELRNFRRFTQQDIDFNKDTVLIHGDNAKGKSTLLEAIYFVLNGHSPWNISYDNFINYEKGDYFTIKILLDDDIALTLYQDKNTKSYLVNQKKVSKKKFFSYKRANLFSPEQIELLMYLPQKRREFLDTLISDIDIEYKENLSLYKKVLRQRNAHLKKLAKKFFETNQIQENDEQIKYWDDMLAKLASKIMAKRAEITDKLKNKYFEIEYRPSITLNLFENMLDAEELEKIYKKQIKENIKRDIVTGFSNIGVHRDDWNILSAKYNLKRFGSRGEKRLGIANLILQTQEIYLHYLGEYPILLLDDMSAELDQENTEKIFKNPILNKQQIFITTTKKENIPSEIAKESQIIELK